MKIKSLHLSPPKEPDRAPKTQYDPNPKNSPIRSKRDLNYPKMKGIQYE